MYDKFQSDSSTESTYFYHFSIDYTRGRSLRNSSNRLICLIYFLVIYSYAQCRIDGECLSSVAKCCYIYAQQCGTYEISSDLCKYTRRWNFNAWRYLCGSLLVCACICVCFCLCMCVCTYLCVSACVWRFVRAADTKGKYDL